MFRSGGLGTDTWAPTSMRVIFPKKTMMQRADCGSSGEETLEWRRIVELCTGAWRGRDRRLRAQQPQAPGVGGLYNCHGRRRSPGGHTPYEGHRQKTNPAGCWLAAGASRGLIRLGARRTSDSILGHIA